MKRKYSWWILLGLVALVTTISCKSKPEPQEDTTPVVETPAAPTPTPAPDNTPDQASLNALNAAADRAAAARKLVSDFYGSSFFPDDWQSADSLYTEAEQQKKTATRQDVQESTARYNKAADAFEAMTEKLYAAAYEYAEKELTAARDAAVAARAEELIPDFLQDADNTVAAALEKYQAKDYYAAKDSAMDAYTMYTALKAGLDAYKLREEITERGFEPYDPVNIELADNTLYSAADDYTAKNYSLALNKAEDALQRYDQALKTAWQSYAAERRSSASAERQKALDLRANVAVRQEFSSADSIYTRANTAFQGRRYEEAAGFYIECEPLFAEASRLTLEKRQAAQEALDRADQRIMESDENAKNVELIVEGGGE